MHGNVSPRAQAQHDQGAVDPGFPVEQVTLFAKLSPEQQRELDQLLTEQQDPSSPKYRRWLTPEQYADRFGLNPEDWDKVESWLQAQGFQVLRRARSRSWIDFSGTAGQIQRAFRTEIHRFSVDGEAHFANVTDPSIPAALGDIAAGFRGLNDFRLKPLNHPISPAFTGTSGGHNLAPGDIATIYNLNALYSAGIDGAGQKIAVVGQTDIDLSKIATFRSAFGLSNNVPQLKLYGTDPGVNNPDGAEAHLDVEWSGAAARNATILYVYSKDVDYSAQNAIDDNLAPVITMSYGLCETQEPPGEIARERMLARQANAQGITWVLASGDAGAADCETSSASIATHAKSVDFPGSMPEVTAVGGTEFNEGSGSYWNTSNGNALGSAMGYIPERVWNDTASAGSLSSGGGGKSVKFSTPWWQMGPGFPNDGGRDVPDVSLSASADHDGYFVCTATSGCDPANGLTAVYGGTSVSAPIFAGILTLLNQYLAAQGGQAGVGNANPTLYWLFQNSSQAFHDIVTGDNIVPCNTGSSADCLTGSMGYNATPGYDQATGLGSVDAYKLVTAWAPLAVPRVTGVSPVSPVTSAQTQTLTVQGIGFQNGLVVVATSPIAAVTTLQGSGQIQNVGSNSFQLQIQLNLAGAWSLQVFNADGRPSNQFYFTVSVASAVNHPPSVTGLSPLVSAGPSQSYTFQFSDPDGWQDLNILNVLINSSLDGRQACYVAYNVQSKTLQLVDDAGDAGGPFAGSMVFNGAGKVSNTHCVILGTGSSAAGSGNTLTLTLNMFFTTEFGGNRVVYLAARDSAQNNTGWQTMGVHGVPPLSSSFPNPVGMSPASGSATNAILTFTFQDVSTAGNLQTAWALINTGIDGRAACYVAYFRPGNQLYLIPDNGDGSQASSMILTGTNSLSNGQCTISAQGSSSTMNGAQLSVNLNVTFKPAFSGPKVVWLATQTLGGAQTSPWQALGAWQVP